MLLVLHGSHRESARVPGLRSKDLAVDGVSSSVVDRCCHSFGVWNTWFRASEAVGLCLLLVIFTGN